MALFNVYDPPKPHADPMARAERMVFVRDGFELGAALLGPIWLASQRHWQGLAIWAAAAAVVAIGLVVVGARPGWIGLALAAMNVIVGFEASDLRRDRLAADGWSHLGLACGDNEAEAERHFFERWSIAPESAGRGVRKEMRDDMRPSA